MRDTALLLSLIHIFSTIGLAAKSLVIDDVIENINLCR